VPSQNCQLDRRLLPVESQVRGNCSWRNELLAVELVQELKLLNW